MAMNLFRRSENTPTNARNPYEQLGFKQNPFPIKPSVNVSSPDPRENGSIYLPELRKDEQNRFDQILIPNTDRAQVRQIAFLMDYATRRGRGIGKTSFLYHQKNRIMQDLGEEISDGEHILFATYVLPPEKGKSRKFWQFCRTIIESLCHEDNPIVSMAIWRLRAFLGVIPPNVLDKISDNYQDTIGSDQWLESENVDVFIELRGKMQNHLQRLGISNELILALVNHGHSPTEFKDLYLARFTESEWRKSAATILFDDLVKLFSAANFTKGLFLIDEVEKIVEPQNTRERKDFTDAIRYYMIDGQCENARLSFYSMFFSIHPVIQEILTPYWESAGLDRFAALSRELESEFTVYLYPLDNASAIPLARAYMEKARIATTTDDLRPFTEEALVEGLIMTGQVPGRFLTLLNTAVQTALTEGWDVIDTEQVKFLTQARTPNEMPEQTIDDAIPPTRVDLTSDG